MVSRKIEVKTEAEGVLLFAFCFFKGKKCFLKIKEVASF